MSFTSTSPLREAREAQGLTIRQLADLAGIGEATVQRAEVGRHQPHRGTRRLLAAALGLDVSAVFPHDDDGTSAGASPSGGTGHSNPSPGAESCLPADAPDEGSEKGV